MKYIYQCIKCRKQFEKPDYIQEGTHVSDNCGGFIKFLGEKEDDNRISERYNELKLDKIKKSTCQGCKLKPCFETPEMLSICQFEAFEYRLRTGKYNISSGTVAGEFSKDVKGVIIDGIPLYVEHLKDLFVARYDTYCLQDRKDPTKFPDQYQALTDDIILTSLLGGITIGIRPVNPETNLCKWICYDVDEHSCEGTIYDKSKNCSR